ncbi:MAG TPA: PAS domain-containing protein, partial [Burkholderiales bacterium]|nr:PAS domain-containing protein [Burkholderiales bacterium]
MRSNLPVTQREYVLRDGMTIVSKTDTKGRITYVNDDFIEASGFSEAELMNQPHNVVRHPDMPEEAFADLWATLKAGNPWTGLVKNRRKNGDFYWVLANATPIRESGTVTGYMSVRSKPARELVEAAEGAYRLFRERRAHGLMIRDGHVVRTGPIDWLNISAHTTLVQRLLLCVALVGAPAVFALMFLFMPQLLEGTRTTMASLLSLIMIVGIVVTVRLARSTARQIKAISEQTHELAQGRFQRTFDARGRDELADLRRALQALRTRLGFELSDTRKMAESAMRIQQALDNVATNVMVADKDYNIIYMNNSVNEMFRGAENDIQRDLPSFSAAALIGSNIDQFHKNPAHQRQMLDRLSSTHRASIKLGGRTFVLSVTPVLNDNGGRLGTAVEWVDRTNEVAVEGEVEGLVRAAGAGDFNKRIDVDNKSGFFAQLAIGMNVMLDTTEKGMQDLGRVLGGLAQGDLTQKIDQDYQGTFGQLKDDANRTLASLTDIIGRIRESTESINIAAREIAQGNSDLSQRTEEQ